MTEELFWKYMKCGGGETLGDPRTPERVEQDGQGKEVRYRDFQRGTIYWTSETGISVWVEEKILQYWRDMGSAGRVLGFPIADWKEGRGRVYNRFQHGTITCDLHLDECEVYRGGKSSQDIRRWISILIIAVIWLIGTIFILNSEGMEQGILSVVTFLLGPLTGLLIYLLWKQPKEKDFDIF
jgi:hypothetical protein